MVLKIRLRQQGRANGQTYRLVVTDARNPRDGKYLEMLGWYNPTEKESQDAVVHAERVQHWVSLGAQITPNAGTLIARVAPDVMKEVKATAHARRIKAAAKRRALKKKAKKA